MCVIVYKEAKVELSGNKIRKMFDSNSHGAGLAYVEDNKVKVIKGLMTIGDTIKAVRSLEGKDLAIHFRLATHGLRNQHQTHPFAVTKSIDNSKIYSSAHESFHAVLFHNGIIKGHGSEKESDTLDFVANTLAYIPNLDTRLSVLEAISDSKFILVQEGCFYMVGNFQEDEGLQCSNLFWKYGSVKYVSSYQGKDFNKSYYGPEDDDLDWVAQNEKPKVSWLNRDTSIARFDSLVNNCSKRMTIDELKEAEDALEVAIEAEKLEEALLLNPPEEVKEYQGHEIHAFAEPTQEEIDEAERVMGTKEIQRETDCLWKDDEHNYNPYAFTPPEDLDKKGE